MCIGRSEGSLRKRHLTKVTLCYVVLYYNIGTGTSMAGQVVARSVFQLTCPTWFYSCSSGVFLLPD